MFSEDVLHRRHLTQQEARMSTMRRCFWSNKEPQGLQSWCTQARHFHFLVMATVELNEETEGKQLTEEELDAMVLNALVSANSATCIVHLL